MLPTHQAGNENRNNRRHQGGFTKHVVSRLKSYSKGPANYLCISVTVIQGGTGSTVGSEEAN